MPLVFGYSEPSIRKNIGREVRAGRGIKQATAIAYRTAREAWKKRKPGKRLPARLRKGK